MRRADTLTTFMCRLSWNLGASAAWNLQGLSRPVMGFLYLYIIHLSSTLYNFNIWQRRWIKCLSWLQVRRQFELDYFSPIKIEYLIPVSLYVIWIMYTSYTVIYIFHIGAYLFCLHSLSQESVFKVGIFHRRVYSRSMDWSPASPELPTPSSQKNCNIHNITLCWRSPKQEKITISLHRRIASRIESGGMIKL
jgi:hypothetical protein